MGGHEGVARTGHAGDQNFGRGLTDQIVGVGLGRGVATIGDQHAQSTTRQQAARSVRRLRVELAVRDFARRDDYAADLVAEVDAARIDQNCELLGRLSRDPQRVRDLSLLLYVATIGSQVVLTGKKGDEDNIRRIEDLVARAIMGQSDEP